MDSLTRIQSPFGYSMEVPSGVPTSALHMMWAEQTSGNCAFWYRGTWLHEDVMAILNDNRRAT